MNDISDILRALLDQYSRASDVGREFKQMIDTDSALMADYKEWCDAMGYSTATGYKDYVDELIDSRNFIWDNINE